MMQKEKLLRKEGCGQYDAETFTYDKIRKMM